MQFDQGVQAKVLSFLSPNEIGRCAQVCKAWQQASADESLWAAKARQQWPPETLQPRAYGSWRALTLDGNALGADAVIPLEGRASAFKYNQPHHFCECRLVALVWDRRADVLRLLFDARGEVGMAHPGDSSLALAVQPLRPDTTPLSSRHVLGALRPTACTLLVDSPGRYKGWLEFPGVAAAQRLLESCLAAEEAASPSAVAGAAGAGATAASAAGVGPSPPPGSGGGGSSSPGASPRKGGRTRSGSGGDFDRGARLREDGWGLHFVYGNALPVSPEGRLQPRLVWGAQFLDYHPVRVAAVPPPTTAHRNEGNSCGGGDGSGAGGGVGGGGGLAGKRARAGQLRAALEAAARWRAPEAAQRDFGAEDGAAAAARWRDGVPPQVTQRVWGV